jgi:hypothetical protein
MFAKQVLFFFWVMSSSLFAMEKSREIKSEGDSDIILVVGEKLINVKKSIASYSKVLSDMVSDTKLTGLPLPIPFTNLDVDCVEKFIELAQMHESHKSFDILLTAVEENTISFLIRLLYTVNYLDSRAVYAPVIYILCKKIDAVKLQEEYRATWKELEELLPDEVKKQIIEILLVTFGNLNSFIGGRHIIRDPALAKGGEGKILFNSTGRFVLVQLNAGGLDTLKHGFHLYKKDEQSVTRVYKFLCTGEYNSEFSPDGNYLLTHEIGIQASQLRVRSLESGVEWSIPCLEKSRCEFAKDSKRVRIDAVIYDVDTGAPMGAAQSEQFIDPVAADKHFLNFKDGSKVDVREEIKVLWPKRIQEEVYVVGTKHGLFRVQKNGNITRIPIPALKGAKYSFTDDCRYAAMTRPSGNNQESLLNLYDISSGQLTICISDQLIRADTMKVSTDKTVLYFLTADEAFLVKLTGPFLVRKISLKRVLEAVSTAKATSQFVFGPQPVQSVESQPSQLFMRLSDNNQCLLIRSQHKVFFFKYIVPFDKFYFVEIPTTHYRSSPDVISAEFASFNDDVVVLRTSAGAREIHIIPLALKLLQKHCSFSQMILLLQFKNGIVHPANQGLFKLVDEKIRNLLTGAVVYENEGYVT